MPVKVFWFLENAFNEPIVVFALKFSLSSRNGKTILKLLQYFSNFLFKLSIFYYIHNWIFWTNLYIFVC